MALTVTRARRPTGSKYSQSLERGLAILSAFRPGRPLLGVSELSREIELSRGTTHRYVATLASNTEFEITRYLRVGDGTVER
jgi:response regulator of citrate/malate metabolism